MDKQIQEGNIAIAIFDGWESGRFEHLPNKLHKMESGELIGISIDQIQYHTSWDWLMPVVEKLHEPIIENGKVVRQSAEVTIFFRNCKIEYTEEFTEYKESRGGEQGKTKIEAVWKAVVKFINWYNNNKQP